MSPINQRPSIVDKPRPRLALAPFLTTLAMAATSLWLCFVLPTTLGKAVAFLVTIPLAYLVFATSEPIWAVRIEITGNEFSYYSKFPRTWPRVDEGRPGTVNLDKISDVRIRMSNNLHPCLTLRDSDGGYLQAPYYFRWSKKEQWEQVVKRAAAARGITTHWDKGDHESKW